MDPGHLPMEKISMTAAFTKALLDETLLELV
jgi:hypothetical protein